MSVFPPLRAILAGALLLLPALLLPACPALAGEAAKPACALLLESAAPDGGMADMLREGFARTCQRFGLQGEVVIADPDSQDQTAVFQDACQRFGLVLVAEGRLHEILRNNAARYPRVMFGCIDTGVRARNIMSVTFEDNQGTFLAGALAAMLVQPGQHLGWLGSEPTPVMKNMLKGFTDGAQVTRPGTRVFARMTGFNKALETGEAVRELAGRNCGAILVAAGYGSRGAYNAAGSSPALLIGLDRDQSGQAPSRVPFSVVKRFDRAVEEIVAAYASGQFQGAKILVYDLANQGVDIAVAKAFKAKRGLPANFETRLGELRREIAKGAIRFEDLHNPTLCECNF